MRRLALLLLGTAIAGCGAAGADPVGSGSGESTTGGRPVAEAATAPGNVAPAAVRGSAPGAAPAAENATAAPAGSATEGAPARGSTAAAVSPATAAANGEPATGASAAASAGAAATPAANGEATTGASAGAAATPAANGEATTGASAAASVGAAATPADPIAAALAAGRFPTAEVLRRTRLRASAGGRALARIGPRTEFGSPSVLSVIRRRGAWLAVHAAQLPNGRAGWLPAAAVRLGTVDLSIHVDRSARRLTVRRGDRVLRHFTVAVGRAGNETPTGRFAVTDKLRMPAGGPYGCCAVALTGHQLRLPSGWAGGDRLAIHGTNAPWSIGQAASLGCMRAAGADIRWLLRRMPLGAPVFIRA